MTTKRVKAGTSKAAAKARREKFKIAYLANGGNATQAAIIAGFSKNGARVAGARMLADANIRAAIDRAVEESNKITGLNLDRTLREVARLAYSDPRKLYRPDGSLIPVRELDDDTAATVASVEVDEIKAGEAGVIGHTVKIKHWDKNAALEKAMKYHGLYEKDNKQKPLMGPLEVRFVE